MRLTSEVPRIGWRWIRCFDAGDTQQQCDLCATESTSILHYVRHREYPDGRFVGSRCAAALLNGQDATDAHESERSIRQRLLWQRRPHNRRASRVNWSLTPDGHDTAKVGVTRVIISQSASRAWAIAIIVDDDERLRFAPETYRYREDAMEAAAALLLNRMLSLGAPRRGRDRRSAAAGFGAEPARPAAADRNRREAPIARATTVV
jgi:hypothetical protein